MIAAAYARHLGSLGIVSFEPTHGGDCFIVHMPDKPKAAVCITPGPGPHDGSLAPVDTTALQFRVRGEHPIDVRAPYARALAIHHALDGMDLVTLDEGGPDEVHVISTVAVGSTPGFIGFDTHKLPEWVVNVLARHHAPSAHRPINA